MLNKNSKVRPTKAQRQEKLKQQKEREELAHTLRQMADKRFPSFTKMSTAKRVDRLELCTAQTLAVMDKLLEFWTTGVCPFTAADPSRPDKDKPEPQPATTTTTTEPVNTTTTTKPAEHSNNHYPYH